MTSVYIVGLISASSDWNHDIDIDMNMFGCFSELSSAEFKLKNIIPSYTKDNLKDVTQEYKTFHNKNIICAFYWLC